jgi:hypothetical protein
VYKSGAPVAIDVTAKNVLALASTLKMTFCIPLYSGIIGVLMPDKKLIPISLMPLELEFSLNPHALYCSMPVSAASAAAPVGTGVV